MWYCSFRFVFTVVVAFQSRTNTIGNKSRGFRGTNHFSSSGLDLKKRQISAVDGAQPNGKRTVYNRARGARKTERKKKKSSRPGKSQCVALRVTFVAPTQTIYVSICRGGVFIPPPSPRCAIRYTLRWLLYTGLRSGNRWKRIVENQSGTLNVKYV